MTEFHDKKYMNYKSKNICLNTAVLDIKEYTKVI